MKNPNLSIRSKNVMKPPKVVSKQDGSIHKGDSNVEWRSQTYHDDSSLSVDGIRWNSQTGELEVRTKWNSTDRFVVLQTQILSSWELFSPWDVVSTSVHSLMQREGRLTVRDHQSGNEYTDSSHIRQSASGKRVWFALSRMKGFDYKQPQGFHYDWSITPICPEHTLGTCIYQSDKGCHVMKIVMSSRYVPHDCHAYSLSATCSKFFWSNKTTDVGENVYFPMSFDRLHGVSPIVQTPSCKYFAVLTNACIYWNDCMHRSQQSDQGPCLLTPALAMGRSNVMTPWDPRDSLSSVMELVKSRQGYLSVSTLVSSTGRLTQGEDEWQGYQLKTYKIDTHPSAMGTCEFSESDEHAGLLGRASLLSCAQYGVMRFNITINLSNRSQTKYRGKDIKIKPPMHPLHDVLSASIENVESREKKRLVADNIVDLVTCGPQNFGSETAISDVDGFTTNMHVLVVHELGHCLGLRHLFASRCDTNGSTSTMDYNVKEDLSIGYGASDDVDRIRELYVDIVRGITKQRRPLRNTTGYVAQSDHQVNQNLIRASINPRFIGVVKRIAQFLRCRGDHQVSMDIGDADLVDRCLQHPDEDDTSKAVSFVHASIAAFKYHPRHFVKLHLESAKCVYFYEHISFDTRRALATELGRITVEAVVTSVYDGEYGTAGCLLDHVLACLSIEMAKSILKCSDKPESTEHTRDLFRSFVQLFRKGEVCHVTRALFDTRIQLLIQGFNGLPLAWVLEKHMLAQSVINYPIWGVFPPDCHTYGHAERATLVPLLARLEETLSESVAACVSFISTSSSE